jgi:tetratricopeptide (TPR) repeat protein
MYPDCQTTFTSKRKYQVKIRIAVFIALSSIATTALAASNRISNGLIIHSSGEVAIERQNGLIVRPTSGTPIYPGDTLRTAQNAQLTIQCADLGIKSIAPGENQLNSCLLAKEESKSDCSRDLIKCPDRGDDKIAWNSAPIPYIISPRRTKLLHSKPILRWNPVAGATSYKLSLRENGAKLNWEITVSGTEAVYPGEPALKPGVRYRLIVEADTGASSEIPLVEGDTEFELLDEKQVQAVKDAVGAIDKQVPNENAKKLAISSLYLNTNLIAEAREILENLQATGVETPPIYRRLGDLYLEKLQLVPQAEVYYSKAINTAKPDDIEELTAARYGLGQVHSAMRNNLEAMKYLRMAKDGYTTLGDLPMVEKVEKQLRDLQRREQRKY